MKTQLAEPNEPKMFDDGQYAEMGNQQAYLKAGIYGSQGGGKTRTASEIAIGLHSYIKSKKPVFFLDTETGSDFVTPLFKKVGIKVVGAKDRTFVALVKALAWAQEHCDIMIIDSVTHIWNELCEAYRRKKYHCFKCNGTGKTDKEICLKCEGTGTYYDKLTVWDYAPIKREWQNQFVEPMLNAKLHMLMCGRAGGVYESQENLEGKKEIIKVDSKFKAESEFGYEASLLLEMTIQKDNKGIQNVATIWKDRFALINGKQFLFPTFKDFLPHIEALNLGGEHVSLETGKSSVESLKTPRGSWDERETQKKILLEEIEGQIVSHYPGASTENKTAKREIINKIFGTYSWTAVETMAIESIQKGLIAIKEYFAKGGNDEKRTGNSK